MNDRAADDEAFATIEQLADRWHTTRSALAQLRYRGRGPAYVKRGRLVLYPWAAIQAYEELNTRETTDAADVRLLKMAR
ncbi:DNA-binding protein [Nocardia nova]|uniref:DNA-binding protein n=1 Tax=Nocardia nova TaxID=37330 RepID=UPI000CEA5328|nr:DNA-binding protein [Nocardia nova]PPJ02586.1 DNA-binding protein [Nocardia nova]